MSRNVEMSLVNSTTRAYPVPQLQRNTINQAVDVGASKSASRANCRCKLGLGVNEQTGRLQWCPGFTCCKFIIILPVVMLPLTLVLIMLMRMDGMLSALRLQQQQIQEEEQQHFNIEHYDANSSKPITDIVSDHRRLPFHSLELSDAERLKRCISFKFRQSEGLDLEEHDLMKDARTSFLPPDSTAMPRECLEILSYGSRLSSLDDYKSAEEYLRRRLRRASRNNYRYYRSLSKENVEKFDSTMPDPIVADDAGDIVESIAGLQSFWNEQGTREVIRQQQAKTMLKYMDTKVNPCDDFYKYACGNWEKLHPIPRDKAGFDTFEMLRENLDIVLKELLESNDGGISNKKTKLTTITDNSYLQETRKSDADRLVQPASSVDGSATKTAAEESKIVQIRPNTPSNSVKAKAAKVAVTMPLEATEPEQLHVSAKQLRMHIINKRAALERLLRRYQRETTNTKRKHFTLHHSSSKTKTASPKVASPKNVPNTAQRKAKHLYQSCINSRLLEKRGIQPLLSLINSLGGWPVLNPHWNEQHFDWLNLTALLRRYNNDILIVEWVGPDIKNSDENVIQFDQTSLGLPTREYFLQEVNAKYLQAYQRFMTEVMHKLGAPEDVAVRTAAELITFESQLAAITSPAEQRLNVTKLYKRMTLRQLHGTVPQINWIRYLSILQQREVKDSEQVVIYAIDYMQDLVSLLGETKPRTVSNYLLWRFVRHRINNVDDRFEDIKQSFYHTLFGREESPSRWKVCIAQVNTNMGMAVGSMFVSKYFDENSKQDTLKMTHELQQAFREILKSTDWLDSSTKHLAEIKVNAMSLKIGYPDFILNPAELNEKYEGIAIDPDKYFENTLNVLLHTSKTEQNKLNEAVNKTAWQTAPAIVNAYYSRNKNQIMFPAGILQPPFYHRHFPRSLNFGGIGVVIGHELTHGFDDKGRLFDKNGSIHKWWTDASIKGFDERARCIIAQYSNYTVGEVGIALNGESTQGENIADNGGIRQAFHAYKRWLQDNPNIAPDERLPGINMSGEQLFFLNFGQVWCGAMRPEAVRNKLNTAIHSPGKFRVIGTLSNSKDFAREFNCPLGSPMNPEHKCSVW